MVNGQKVWTSGAHDADVILTFVRTDPDAPKHKGISALLIPTDTPGVERRPFASVFDRDSIDFNEVFFTDVRGARREPRRSTQRRVAGRQRIARSRTHDDVDGVRQQAAADCSTDYRPDGALDRDRYATIAMDYQALRLLGSAALGQAARGERDIPAVSVLKVFGSEAEQNAVRHVLEAAGADGLISPALTAPYNPYSPDLFTGSWFARYIGTLCGHHLRWNVGDPAQHHRAAVLASGALRPGGRNQS